MFAMPGEDVEPIVSTLEYNEMGDVSIKISDSYWGDEKEAVVYGMNMTQWATTSLW